MKSESRSLLVMLVSSVVLLVSASVSYWAAGKESWTYLFLMLAFTVACTVLFPVVWRAVKDRGTEDVPIHPNGVVVMCSRDACLSLFYVGLFTTLLHTAGSQAWDAFADTMRTALGAAVVVQMLAVVAFFVASYAYSWRVFERAKRKEEEHEALLRSPPFPEPSVLQPGPRGSDEEEGGRESGIYSAYMFSGTGGPPPCTAPSEDGKGEEEEEAGAPTAPVGAYPIKLPDSQPPYPL